MCLPLPLILFLILTEAGPSVIGKLQGDIYLLIQKDDYKDNYG